MSCCSCHALREEIPFRGPEEFFDFLKELKASDLKKIPAARPRRQGMDEEWYECPKCKQTWRLVLPDPPFAGAWEKVSP